MTIKDVKELIALVSKANLAEFKYKDNDFELTIRGGEFHKSKAMPIMTAVQPITVSPAPDAVPAPVVVESPVAAAPAAPAPAPAVENPTGTIEIKSPMVGTFYRSAGPDKPAFTKVGDVVDEKTTVCIIEAMKLFNEIESEVKGRIVKVLVEDASPVEYGQPLFLVDPKG